MRVSSAEGRTSAMLRVAVMAAAIAGLFGVYVNSAAMAADAPPKPLSASWADPMFTQPFIDIDEWRDKPVRHRYVHGGFKGTNTLFSIYLPPKEQYQGRFFQPVAAVAGNENAAIQQAAQVNPMITYENTTIGFAAASGGFLLESNLGSTNMYGDGPLSMFRASAAVAQYARTVAAEMYGPHRAHGYTYGGSGGGYKTMAAAENTSGIWDGFVPYVIGSPYAGPYVFMVQAHAARLLKDKWHDVVDALDAGGSGNMYATLNKEQADALREATRFGMPPRVWYDYSRLGYGPLATGIDGLVARDPGYFEDFWKVPGYLGANPPESLKQARIQHKTTITKIVMSDEARKLGLLLPMAANGTNVIPAAFQVAQMPKGDLMGSTIVMTNGGAKDQKLSISATKGDYISLGVGAGAFKTISAIKVGDELLVDNSIYLAAQTYQRHVWPGPEYPAWDQYLGKDGKPIYPQRPQQLRRGDTQSGQFEGKMIVVDSMMDEYAYPWHANWYRGQVTKVLGPKVDEQFRLWYDDNAIHGSGTGVSGPERTRIISYATVLQQALRDVSAWAEKGTTPPANTVYKVVDAQVELPAKAADRKGIQPVVTLAANGRPRADVKVGEKVTFLGTVDVPPKTGTVVEATWDFDGSGDFAVPGEVKLTDKSGEHATVTTTYSFDKPGTYFAVLHVASQRQPDNTPYARIPNIARARIVVK